ncbi:MAG: long-chain fatty acid--CoA ligase [Lutibacter sp.]|uniref:AMP-dependent synthetase/ligase n=1 Tax=Lutibacter sp. TaxID=1925666 RepID=UPI00183D3BE8|nr:long-chain fatty acid--CoA ligase [Lutibacter sp.]MBT8316099.1 long-chain fatty acid--CoA ligase [Lutibacter sp.]NNJ56959.1 long-chain fatty acid--CoA ligase [Lutibacter sp.]
MAKEITRLFDFAHYQLEKYNLKTAFNTKYNGKWVATSTQEYISKANAISRGLLKLGVKPGDKIAVISSNNRTEWNILDIGVLQIGAINIPIYPTISKEDYEYIFNHAEVTHCFLSDNELYDKAIAVKDKVPTLTEIYSFEEIKGCKNWNEVLELGKDETNQHEVEKLMSNVKAGDLATIIYTSGTTGRPKGVMLSHNNIVTNVLDSYPRLPLTNGSMRILSFLPVCHIFERMLHYLYQYAGVSIYFAEGIDKIGENVKEVKPSLMSVVPRLLEKIYDGIITKGSELKGIKKILFFWAVDLGLKYEPYQKNGWFYEKKLALANKLIFSKWREALGGNLTTMVSGSAALQPRLARVFTAANMQIMEGYGLTETSPVVSVNKYDGHLMQIGTVGKPIDNVEVKIAEDGEILIKGPNVMMGYYKDEEKTSSVMTGEYFHTGDKGEVTSDGFLKITGRKKEIFKTSGGKYVVPALLENQMKQSRFIEQILVVGEGQKMPSAIIQPHFEFLREWSRIHHEPILGNNQDLIENPHIIERIQQEIDHGNKSFGKWETIKRFELTPDIWGIDNGLLTPTMKPKRTEILKKYQHLYNKIYEIS